MFFTFDNKRPKDGDDSYVNECRLVRSELRHQVSEPGGGGASGGGGANGSGSGAGGGSYCHTLADRQATSSLDKNQCLSESGYVLSNAGERAKNLQQQRRERFSRHTIHYHHNPSLQLDKSDLLDAVSKSNSNQFINFVSSSSSNNKTSKKSLFF